MHQKLIDFISQNSVVNTKEITSSVLEMIAIDPNIISLKEEQLLNALSLEGEFLVLNLHYNDFQDELKNEKIKYKISQALSIIVSYEDDGASYQHIEKFVKYIYNISDDKQNSTFGVKKVKKLSQYPIKILFSGILPINQLRMGVGQKIYSLIHSDNEYFLPRFQKFRDDISKEISIPILPILPHLDTNLNDLEVQLIDLYDGRVISNFKVCNEIDKDSIEIYLLKLFYIYKVLAEEKCKKE